MISPQGRRLAAAALLLWASGCATRPDEPIDPFAAERVVTELPSAAGKPQADAAEVAARSEQAFAAAESAWRAGDALTALALSNKALLEGVAPVLEPAFRELRAKARGAVVATKICRVRALADRDVVADGEPLGVRIEFANLSGATLRVPRAQPGTSEARLVLTLVREDFDVYGNRRSSDYTLNVPVQTDLELAPGSSQETRLTVPPGMVALSHQGFSVLDLSGIFRPVALRVGESEFFDAIPLESARVRILPKGFEPLAADPLGSLRRAIEKRSPPHVLTCVELLAPADRDAAAALLEEAKAKDAALAPVADAALARLASPR